MLDSKPGRGKKLSSSKRSGLLCGPHSFLYNRWQRAFSTGVKRPGRKTDDLPPFNARIKKEYRYMALYFSSILCLYGVYLFAFKHVP